MRLHVIAAVLFLPAVLAAAPPEPIGRHFILEPQHPLQSRDVAALEAQGLTVQRAMGANRFLVRVRDGADLGSDLRVRSLEAYDWTRKIARSAYAGAASGRAFARFRVMFHDDVAFEDARDAVEEVGGTVETPLAVDFERPRLLTVRVPPAVLRTLASDERVFGVFGPPLRVKSTNTVAAGLSKVTPLFSAPYNLSGEGVVLSLFELAAAETSHLQFQGRLTAHFSSGVGTGNALHATHVAGTMVSGGIDDPRDSRAARSKGMAPKAALHEYNALDDFGKVLNNKDTQLKPLGVVADNNSWDFALGWQREGSNWVWNGDYFGAYDPVYSTPYEAVAVKSGIPLFVHSAGNDADQGNPGLTGLSTHLHCCDDSGNTLTNETFCYSPSGSGTDCTTPCSPGRSAVTGEQHCETTKHPIYGPFNTIGIEATLKNVLTVGAMDATGLIASFSSRGPTLDGRMKPELVAKGVGQLSTIPGGYASRDGTSMSSPVVTGIAGVLTEQWHKTFNGQKPSGQVLKTLLIAGADDQVGSPTLDRPGPDYTYGFGLVDAKSSVDLIIADAGTGSRIRSGSLANGSTELPLYLAAPQDLRVVLGWFDPEIAPPPDEPETPTLFNDLDLKVIDPSGATVLPYVLNPATPSVAATRGVNTIDTTEVVEIKGAAAGAYRVIVNAKLGDPTTHPTQDFVVVSNAPLIAAPVSCADAFEPNDSEALSFKFLHNAETISARSCNATDIDFYSINAPKAGSVVVNVTASAVPLRVTLSGAGLSPNPVIVDVPAGTTRSLFATAAVGVYLLKVEPFGAVGAQNTYTISTTLPEVSPARRRAARH
ncbi:MAG: S8 family serine peptidase [Acidobacteriota bacterium]